MNKYYIECSVSVYEDRFEEGEIKNVNNYSLEHLIKAPTPKKAIEYFFEKILCYNFNYQDSFVQKNTLQYDVLVDANNFEPTEKEIENWKEGKIKLYSSNILISIEKLKKVKLDGKE